MAATVAALVAAALFTGAAIYINLAEQPARLSLDDPSLLREWSLAYDRGLVMQVTLALAGFVLGAIAWWWTGRLLCLAGSAVLILNLPYTLAIIRPLNDALKRIPPERAGAESRRMIERWAALHAVRGALGAAATLLFAVAAAG